MSINARIEFTDSTCIVSEASWEGIPTLVWPEGIDEAASDWLRTIVVEFGVAQSTAYEYAKILRPYLRFCRDRRRAWSTADDSFLLVWREYLRRGLQVSDDRVNTSLSIVFAFYRWAEETKKIRYQVGIYTSDNLPLEYKGHVFPISAKQCFKKSSHGKVFGNWTTTLGITRKGSPAPMRHTPTEDEIQKLHEIILETPNGERDSLMFSWTEETGIRRAEILRIRKTDLPNPEQLAKCIENDSNWSISVIRKGGSKKNISVPPDLVIRTQEYIDIVRTSVVDNCQKKITGYREPEVVFISSTKGMPLHQDSVTSIGMSAFKKAGIGNASGHRLRARFAARTIETLVDALFTGDLVGPESSWAETILIKAAELMGHSSPESLRPYLTYVLNRRIQTSDACKAERLAARIRQLVLQESALVGRLEEQGKLQMAARLMKAGSSAQAADVLQDLVNRLREPAVAVLA